MFHGETEGEAERERGVFFGVKLVEGRLSEGVRGGVSGGEWGRREKCVDGISEVVCNSGEVL